MQVLALTLTLTLANTVFNALSQDATPVTPPAAATSDDPLEVAKAASAARVYAFLGALEQTSFTIKSMSGALALESFDALVEETQRRYGRFVMERSDAIVSPATTGEPAVNSPPLGARRFALYFDEFVDGSGRSDRSIDHWIYSDGWLCEQDYRNKSFTKRQIVAPGQTLDPLALGEGPIPIPMGQKRADVLARFDVSEQEIPQDIPLLGSLQNVAGLRLVPKPDTSLAKDTLFVELFYDRTTLALTGVVSREKNGNLTVARINAPVVNGAVSDADRALLTIGTPDPKEWSIDVRPWTTTSDAKPSESSSEPSTPKITAPSSPATP